MIITTQPISNIIFNNPFRRTIIDSWRLPEETCVPLLIEQAKVTQMQSSAIAVQALELVTHLRTQANLSPVEGLLQEFALSSQEGIALMCLTEALLRIPDNPTRDALIRDKIGKGNWRAHLGQGRSIFVNAATWGLLISGKLMSTHNHSNLGTALTRLIARGGEPLIRKGVDMAMRMLGEQFVCGKTIDLALKNAQVMEREGFRYSYDMLGEGATCAEDAMRYYEAYKAAICAIGQSAQGKGILAGPGISIKLSGLHPRYCHAQKSRVMTELLPCLLSLSVLARQYDVGINIDAEESERLEISLDLLEALCFSSEMQGWNGIGFVVQAYQKRAPFVLDFIIDLAKRSQHRIMVRLVKGAYWDSEIKRAQIEGQVDYPVYTRKVYTDISYIACAKKMLAAPCDIYPQFATHNAQTLATIYHLALDYSPGRYEFQCLHGMGESLYRALGTSRPCRIYGPVGNHETLLAYLVRRLLENGANSSFVNRIADPKVALTNLIVDPVDVARKITPLGAMHKQIPLPIALYGAERFNSIGVDWVNDVVLAEFSGKAKQYLNTQYQAGTPNGNGKIVSNPANCRDQVGKYFEADERTIDDVVNRATSSEWANIGVFERACILKAAADKFQERRNELLVLLVRETGKTLPNAQTEIREAVDFLRYYAQQITALPEQSPLGVVLCISPWNFPLAIFLGQIVAALAMGNSVIAKPAEQTPLIATLAVKILHQAGVDEDALQILCGSGEVLGAALVENVLINAVLFTGSTDVAHQIAQVLARRTNPDGKPVAFIAETGGQNALIVDSSALPEQVVGDVLISAFDSAGQRCSALRVLCLQEDIADSVLPLLKGAMKELCLGFPVQLSTDIGPVIDSQARKAIETYIALAKENGAHITQFEQNTDCVSGNFVAPVLIELPGKSLPDKEIFGPVLHVVRWKATELDTLLSSINATGYGLTFGIHSRIDETINYVCEKIHAGNLYVNRNIIGAVVGVQPFGGEGLSGTGPKAGGPLYLGRLCKAQQASLLLATEPNEQFEKWESWLKAHDEQDQLQRCARARQHSHAGLIMELLGPTGERNIYQLRPRGQILCCAKSLTGLYAQLCAVLVSGNQPILQVDAALKEALPYFLNIGDGDKFSAALFEGEQGDLLDLQRVLSINQSKIVPVYVCCEADIQLGADYPIERLYIEKTLSINTAAAGGNAPLMTLIEELN